MNKQEITKRMQALIDKWKDKPDAPPMSKEWIDRKFDRIKYKDLLTKLAYLDKDERPKQDMLEMAKEVFENEASGGQSS